MKPSTCNVPTTYSVPFPWIDQVDVTSGSLPVTTLLVNVGTANGRPATIQVLGTHVAPDRPTALGFGNGLLVGASGGTGTINVTDGAFASGLVDVGIGIGGLGEVNVTGFDLASNTRTELTTLGDMNNGDLNNGSGHLHIENGGRAHRVNARVGTSFAAPVNAQRILSKWVRLTAKTLQSHPARTRQCDRHRGNRRCRDRA